MHLMFWIKRLADSRVIFPLRVDIGLPKIGVCARMANHTLRARAWWTVIFYSLKAF